MFKHLLACQGITKNAKIKLDIIDNYNDPINLHLLEALKIRKLVLSHYRDLQTYHREGTTVH